MSQYVYHKITGQGWFTPDHICRDKYYEPCFYCNKKDDITAYYSFVDWKKYSQRHILISYHMSRDKITKAEAEALFPPEHAFYHFRFYCYKCKSKYLKNPILGADSMDDGGESALDEATGYWNHRTFDSGKLSYWER